MIFFHVITLILWPMIALGGDSHIKVIGMLVVWLIGCKSQILASLRP